MNKKIFIPIYIIFLIGCSPEIAENQLIIKENIIEDYKDYEIDESQTILKKLNLNKSFDNPWGFDFINDNEIVITEKNGKLSLINLSNEAVSEIKHQIPSVQHGQGGLLDIIKHNDYLYVSFTIENNQKKYTTAIGRGKFVSPFNILTDFQILFIAEPFYSDGKHFGSRIVIKDDQIYASIGERGQGDVAQDLNSHAGSIIRINLDGTIPENPYLNDEGALAEIFMIGVRNPQGMALTKDNEIYISNHGAKGGDFIGLVDAKKNYGWDKIGWGGTHYSGFKIGAGDTFSDEFYKPILSWVPSIAPSDIVFYNGDEFADWNGDLIVSSLKYKMLIKLEFKEGRVINRVIILKDKIGRVRDVDINSKGEIFLISDEKNSGLWKLKSN